MRYLLVSGGVISGLGKGITASSLGVLLQTHGCRVTTIKIDPYLNLDSGTMSPFEHGECFVLDDGCEVDLDLGNYERFLGIELTRDHNITTGKIYKKVLDAERRGDYLGATVQVVPHITDAITEWISQVAVASDCDVCIIELGGTIGDMESLPFLEALRQMVFDRDNQFCHVHVGYVPVLKVSNELKTKPTQRSVTDVRKYGLHPDFLCLRCERSIPTETLSKIEKFCGVPASHIIENSDVSNIYSVSVNFAKFIPLLWDKLALGGHPRAGNEYCNWRRIAYQFGTEFPTLNVAVVGKYSGLTDSYLSLSHAIRHAAVKLERSANIIFIESSKLDNSDLARLKGCDAVIIPGGFGNRGIEGMVDTVKYARTNKIPLLGICLGMQVMVIEWARNVWGLTGANSTEFSKTTSEPVLIIMDEQQQQMGGTMRLGTQPVHVVNESRVSRLYGKLLIRERHRHRYEVNPSYHCKFSKIPNNTGLAISAFDASGQRVETVEWCQDQRFYIGCQFHPEYQTYPDRPHPLFLGLLSAAVNARCE